MYSILNKFFLSSTSNENTPLSAPSHNSVFYKAIAKLLEVKPSIFRISPYGDSEIVQLIQKKKFDEALDSLKNDEAYPKKDLCRFTLTGLAALCGATLEQIQSFAFYDLKYGHNMETRSVNGYITLAMMAVNMVNMDELKGVLQSCGSFGEWMLETAYLNRTVAHALFLPSLQKGQPSDEQMLEMATFLVKAGAKFDVADDKGNTALEYAALYYPDLDLSSLGLQAYTRTLIKNQQLDFWGMSEIQYAILFGQLDKLNELLADDATLECNSTLQTSLHEVGVLNYLPQDLVLEMTNVLLAANCPYAMNQSDVNGFYPIHNAAAFGVVSVFERLLSLSNSGVTYAEQLDKLTDFQGRTCAHHICMGGGASDAASEQIAGLILNATCSSAIFLQADKFGLSPFFYACLNRPSLALYLYNELKLQAPLVKSYLERCMSNPAVTVKLSGNLVTELLNCAELPNTSKETRYTDMALPLLLADAESHAAELVNAPVASAPVYSSRV